MADIRHNFWLQLAIGLAVVALAAGAGAALYLTRAEPERVERERVGPLVETMRAERTDVPVVVRGHGTVEARVRSSIVPQVSGRVVSVHDQLAAGGFVAAGEALIEIDDSDYRLAYEAAETDLERAEAAAETAEAQIAEAEATLADARIELERLQRLYGREAVQQREVERAQLAVDVAEAALRRARSSLSTAGSQRAAARVAMNQAELDLQRTRVTLPFDAMVIEEQVSAGQFVTAGQPVGRVFGTDAVEIAVPMDDREAGWLAQLPLGGRRSGGAGGAGSAAGDSPLPAEVRGEFFGRLCVWQGEVVRIEGQMDRQSRMVRVVVRVDEPYAEVAGGAVPLMPGAFVEVAMEGRQLAGVIPVPRYAVHEDDTVWVVDDGRLRVRQVRVARRERGTVYLQEGVSAGEQVILSPLDAVTDGMLVRTEPAAEGKNEQAVEMDTPRGARADEDGRR